ncbi:MAG: MarR family transcriptional regulator [Ruminococcaceae bacterium]|nr:MarR family transcriptional regulator [Oscillospiraceae bacterium]
MIFIMRKINTISRCGIIYRGDKLEAEIIKPNHHGYAICVFKNPGISQEEISEKLCINKSNVTRALDAMEAKGFIFRETNPNDKRSLKVYPTDKLNGLMPKILKLAKEWNNYLTECISEEELEVFQKVLGKITDRAHLYMESRSLQK